MVPWGACEMSVNARFSVYNCSIHVVLVMSIMIRRIIDVVASEIQIDEYKVATSCLIICH